MLSCPQCSIPLIKGELGYTCSSCHFGIPFVFRGVRLSAGVIEALLAQGESPKQSWKRRDTGGLILGSLILSPSYTVQFKPSYLPHGKCPLCSSPILETPIGWECEKGEVVVWNTIASRPLAVSEVQQLFLYGVTDELAGFVSKETGKRFSAKLTIKSDGSVGFVFA